MSESIKHSVTLDHPFDAVYRAMTSKDVIAQVVQAYGPDGSELLEYEGDDSRTRYKARVSVPEENLGFLTRMATDGDVVVILEQTWSRAGDAATGQVVVTMEKKPEQKVALNTGLEADGDSTTWTVDGVVDVSGLFGGKVESTIVEQVDKLVSAEAAYLDVLLRGNPES